MFEHEDSVRLCKISSTYHRRENNISEPETIFVFKIFYEELGGGTRLAMPKTISAPDSSSLKPGSGATEGVLD